MPRSIPYGHQWIEQDDIESVMEVLSSDWLTTGPKVAEFENAVSKYCGVASGVAVTSGTAALHAIMYAVGIEPGDEVIVPAITFAATANSVVFLGGRPVFCDVDGDSLLMDPNDVRRKISPRTKAIVAVDFAGQPCDYDLLRKIAEEHGIVLISDACHSLGATYKSRKAGAMADITAFSFHPVKQITTGEGGMAVSNNERYCDRMRMFRNHGITTDFRQRAHKDSWFYEMVDLGFNYRITDFQCALGINQLAKLDRWIKRRRQIAGRYDRAFAESNRVKPLAVSEHVGHAYHLYVVKVAKEKRADIFQQLRAAGIGVNVHYIPVHFHPFYRNRFGTEAGMCPVAEECYEQIISLPMYPALPDSDIEYVIEKVKQCVSA